MDREDFAGEKGDVGEVGRLLERALRAALRDVVREVVGAVVREELNAWERQPRSAAATTYLTTDEAAGLAKVEPATVREWMRRGELERHHAGRELRVRRDDLERFLHMGRRSEPERNVEDIALRILAGSKK